MTSIKFIFNKIQTIIQCNLEDLMRDICKRFADKMNLELNKLNFIYEFKEINYELTFNFLNFKKITFGKKKFNEQANEYDKQNAKMTIIVYYHKDFDDIWNNEIIKSKDIICPKCGENCLLNIKNYQISFYGCKNNDKLNNILFFLICLFI